MSRRHESTNLAQIQHFISGADSKRRMMILGGSAARGMYASLIAKTYFHVLGESLEKLAHPFDITVVATGAWKSSQELAALQLHGPAIKPDVIVFLDGLSDLTMGATADALDGEVVPGVGVAHTHDYQARVQRYLANIARAARFAGELKSKFLVVLQPSLTEKEAKSDIEQRLLQLSLVGQASAEAIQTSYEAMRRGLRQMEQDGLLHFLDASRIFDVERHTTFTDMWHFTDFGHALLGQRIAEKIASDAGLAHVRAPATDSKP